jgi:hypothetical protein
VLTCTSALGRPRQEDQEFDMSLNYPTSPASNKLKILSFLQEFSEPSPLQVTLSHYIVHPNIFDPKYFHHVTENTLGITPTT